MRVLFAVAGFGRRRRRYGCVGLACMRPVGSSKPLSFGAVPSVGLET